MSAAQNALSVSEIIRLKEEEATTSPDQVKSREDWKKQKELEEARKAGTAPAAVDESGRDINPHIPQYISAAPWYYSARGPTLRHQRIQDDSKKVFSTLNEWYKRGVDPSKIVTKYRKGACENCGAMTHKKKDCLERPRQTGAKFSNTDIAPDEHAQPTLALDFDGKRDRWNGYDANEYLAIVDEFQKVEDAKRILKTEKLRTGQGDGDALADNMVMDEEGPEEDEDKYVDDIDMPGTKVDSKQRITVRNLRIREDTAKYLRNLDPNSAYYDPKTRSMRDNPYKGTGKTMEELDFAGENFVRFTGDTNRHAQAQLFAWEAQERGVDVHLLAEPTKLEVLKKEFQKKKEEFKGSLTKNIIDKYGGEVHLDAPPKSLLMAQTEDYIEYSRQGKIIKGGERPVIRSKYEEDVFPMNHCSVFGSFWRAGAWGYQCCHSLIRNSYCTGEAGRLSNDAGAVPESATDFNVDFVKENKDEPKTLVEIHRALKRKAEEEAINPAETEEEESSSKKKKRKNEKRRERRKKRKEAKKRKRSSSSDDSSDDSADGVSSSDEDSDEGERKERKIKKRDLKKALKEEQKRNLQAEEMLDDRARPYNSRYDVKAPTEAEVEAYQITRMREEDPMLQFVQSRKKKN